MTSTEFNIGYEGSRVSSKVLKPPGGGSSDIFGSGSMDGSAANECARNKEAASRSQNRLFGASDDDLHNIPASKFGRSNIYANAPPAAAKLGVSNDNQNTPSSKYGRSNIFANAPPAAPKSSKKPYVRRNPITGEEIEIYSVNKKTENNDKEENGNSEKTENDDKEENGDCKKDDNVEENGEEEKKAEVPPMKPVQTSIRVRNPPGGKSSGIF